MKPAEIISHVFMILGGRYTSIDAARMLLAIGYQESGFIHRRQVKGPAVGFWQFEKGGGILGVMRHHTTRTQAKDLLTQFELGTLHRFNRPAMMNKVYEALQKEEYDVLAGCFARLLLWTHPKALPGADQKEEAWQYYLDTWRPGKPHRNRWDQNWERANQDLLNLE